MPARRQPSEMGVSSHASCPGTSRRRHRNRDIDVSIRNREGRKSTHHGTEDAGDGSLRNDATGSPSKCASYRDHKTRPNRTASGPAALERRDCRRRDTRETLNQARSVTAAQLTELRGSRTRGGGPGFPRRPTGARRLERRRPGRGLPREVGLLDRYRRVDAGPQVHGAQIFASTGLQVAEQLRPVGCTPGFDQVDDERAA